MSVKYQLNGVSWGALPALLISSIDWIFLISNSHKSTNWAHC